MVCILSGPEHRFEFVNPAHVKVLGLDATGKTVREAQPESVEIHHILDEVYRSGQTAELHEIPVTVSGRLRYFNLTCSARRDAEGQIDGIMLLGVEITDQVLLREALRERESELSFALSCGKLGTWSVDFARGGKVKLSGEAAAMLGCSDEYRDRQAAADALIHPEDRPRILRAVDDALENGTPYNIEYRVVMPSGEVRWFNSRGRARYAEGKLQALSGLLLDVTEQKSSEESQRSSRHLLELAATVGRVGFWHVNTETGTFEPDERTALDWGIDLVTFARTFEAGMALVHPEDRGIIASGMASALAGTEAYDKEFRVVLPSGDVRWIQCKGEFYTDEKGKKSLFSGVSIDITEKKLGQLARQRIIDAIAKERRNLEEVLEQIKVPTALLSGPNHTHAFANSAYNETFGLARSPLGKTIADIFPDAIRQGFGALLDKVYATGETFAGKEIPFERQSPSGEVRSMYLDLTYAAKRDPEGRIEGVLTTIVDVTDRVLLRKATEEANARMTAEKNNLNEIFRSSPAAMATWAGPRFVFERVNPEYAKIFGDRPLVGRELLDACPELAGQGFEELLQRVYETGEPVIGIEVPAHVAKVQGGPTEERFFDFKYVRIHDSDGKPHGVYDFAIDVTDRVHAQRTVTESAAKLREAEDLLRRAIQVAKIGFYDWDVVNNRISFSTQMQKDWGLKSGSSLEAVVLHIHADDRERVMRSIGATVDDGVQYFEEYRVLRPTDGKTVWIEAQGELIRDKLTQEVRFIGTSLDITARKRSEALLKSSAEEFRLVANTLPQMVWTADPTGAAEWTNKRWYEYTGLREEQTRGWGFKAVFDPVGVESMMASYRRAIETGESLSIEHRVRMHGGQYRWQLIQARPLIGATGEILRWFGTCTDIEEQKQLEEQLKSASIEARNASIAKSAFLANMSHEIRTPLGAIMGFSELLKNGGLTAADHTNFVSVIQRNSQHLLRIVDDILDLSKVEAGKMAFENIEFSLLDLLSDFTSLMGFRARDKGIDFTLELTSPIPDRVISDPTRLRQILNNIVGNAIKFTDRGLVELILGYEGCILNIRVKDTGRGISADQAARLFEAFVQADESTTRKYGGTGLGLVLTRRLASAMGGDFYLKESEPGQGSVFEARVRVEHSPKAGFVGTDELHFSTSHEPARPVAQDRLSGMRILVVDDSPDNRTLLSVMLRNAGASVEAARDGIEGVEMALSGRFDAILMDIQMPRLDGYQALESLKRQRCAAPVIALTAHAMVEERERAQGKGFAAFMTKPIDGEALLDLLEGLRAPARAEETAPGSESESELAETVLVVEDDPDTLWLMEHVLAGLGRHVRSAHSGGDAVREIEQGLRPALVLLDLTLPDMDGSQVLSAIRAHPNGDGARIIVVSGWNDLEQRAGAIGADGALRKPLDLQHLESVVRSLG